MAFDPNQDDIGIGEFTPNDTTHFPGVPGRTGKGGYRGPNAQMIKNDLARIEKEQKQMTRKGPTPGPISVGPIGPSPK